MDIIGFGGKFYTLWNVTEERVADYDENGRVLGVHVKQRYCYRKNISHNLEITQQQYPDLTIDMTLCGRKWFIRNKYENLTPEILKFGKYKDRNIYDLVKEDQRYVLWLSENCHDRAVLDLCNSLPEIVAIKKSREDAEAAWNSKMTNPDGVKIRFLANPNTEDETIHGIFHCAWAEVISENGEPNRKVIVYFSDAKYVGGMYPYWMGYINGKYCRTKHKEFTTRLYRFNNGYGILPVPAFSLDEYKEEVVS